MLKQSLQKSRPFTPEFLVPAGHMPSFLSVGSASFAITKNNYSPLTKKPEKTQILRRRGSAYGAKAVLTSSASTEKSTSVKAVITVLETLGGALTHLGLSRGLDDIADLLGKTLLIELAAAELDPGN